MLSREFILENKAATEISNWKPEETLEWLFLMKRNGSTFHNNYVNREVKNYNHCVD